MERALAEPAVHARIPSLDAGAGPGQDDRPGGRSALSTEAFEMKLDELWTYFGTALAVVFALVIAVTALAGGSITTAALVGAYGVGAAVLVFAVSLAVAGARRRGSRS